MSEYLAKISWQRHDEDFLNNKYSRAHRWQFDGGTEVAASASPHIVPLPWARPEHVDPEQAFVASLSSCHMLFFLSLAAQQGFQVDSYEDNAIGTLSRDSTGKHAMTRVCLRPRIEFSGDRRPDSAAIEALHHAAHEHCFIANSVRTAIEIEPA